MAYLIIAFRILSSMTLILFLTLKTGRRKIGELPVYDFLSIIVVGSVIGADIAEPNVPHLPTLFAILFLVVLQYLVSRLLINNKKIAKKITFGPTVIIQNGQFLKSNMERLKYPVENILMALREKDIFDLNEVEYAIIEGSGNISVLKKAALRPLTPSDMHILPHAKGITVPVIIDGAVLDENLMQLGHDRIWLSKKLLQMNIRRFEEVFYADCSLDGKLYVSRMLETGNLNDRFTL